MRRRGIAGLPAYQNGGSPQEDRDFISEEYRELVSKLQRGPLDDRPASIYPDTLMGADRARMMRWFDKMGSNQVSQRGIGDLLRGDEYRDFIELMSELRGTPAPIATYFSPSAVGGRFRNDEIKMNIGTPLWKKEARDWPRGFPIQTAGGWEEAPAEDFLRSLYHEGHHSLEYPPPIPLKWLDPYAEAEGLSPREQRSDDFGAVLEAVRNAEPGDSREDVLREAQRLYWDISTTGYKFERLKETEGSYTGEGSYSDPLVVDPEFLEAMRPEQAIQMEPHLDLILGTEKHKDHPLNWSRGERMRRGIGSFFSRLLGRNEP